MEEKKKLNLKIIIPIMIVVILIIAIITFVNMNIDNANNLINNKGTIDNPYKIGDTVKIDGIYNIYNPAKKDISYSINFKINKKYSTSEGEGIRDKEYDKYTYIPVASVTFEIKGDDDSVQYGDLIKLKTLDENLETNISSIENENQKQIAEVYIGKEYNYNITRQYEQGKNNANIEYIIIEYRNKNNELQKIYIKLEEQLETSENNQEKKDSNNSVEAKKYNSGLSAEEKGYYTIALNIFSEIPSYSNSNEHYENMKNILKEYDGTYYGESAQYENVNVYLYIKDGKVRAKFKDVEMSSSKYELYSYGKNENGKEILAFADSRTSLFSLNNDTTYGDRFDIQKLEDGSYLVAATEGSTSYAWNGFYNKISDTVDDKTIFEY